MEEKDKLIKIEDLKEKKKVLSPTVQKAFQAKNIAFETYTELNNKWLHLKKEWEELDREEKTLFFSIPKNKTVIRQKNAKISKEKIEKNAKEKALKTLENLPPEIRAQVLANFK